MTGRLGYTHDLSKTKKQQILCKGKTPCKRAASTSFRNLETEMKINMAKKKKTSLEMWKWWNG